MNKWLLGFIFISGVLLSCGLDARTVWLGRYLSITHRSGIHIIITRHFPKKIQTIGEAIRYTLRGTPYRLLAMSRTSELVKKMYQRSLPNRLRHRGPASLEHVLLSLSGKSYQLVVDPKHHLITYNLKHIS